MADFHTKTDAYPLVSITDELIIVHRNQVVPSAVVYIGCHRDCTVEFRSAANRDAVEGASPFTTLNLPSGGKGRVDLPGTAALDLVTKITPTKGQIYVWIGSMGEFDTYFKQVDVPSI
jgi:hypothetical protein